MSIRRFIAAALIRAVERKAGQSMDYLRDINAVTPGGIWKFFMFVPFAAHGAKADAEMLAMGRIAACRNEDCGPCLQIVVDTAIEAGVDPTLVQAAANGAVNELPELPRLAFEFGRAVASATHESEGIRLKLSQQLSKETMTNLAISIATARVFPSLKRGLGHNRTCKTVQIMDMVAKGT